MCCKRVFSYPVLGYLRFLPNSLFHAFGSLIYLVADALYGWLLFAYDDLQMFQYKR